MEWVSGELPETEAIKLITIAQADGHRRTTTGFVSKGLWYEQGQGLPLSDSGSIVLAWAALPLFEGERDGINQQNGATFGEALEAMKDGVRVRRFHWPLGSCLWLMPEANVKAEWCREPHLKELAESRGGSVRAAGAIRCVSAMGDVLTGWAPTIPDLLAKDWLILD